MKPEFNKPLSHYTNSAVNKTASLISKTPQAIYRQIRTIFPLEFNREPTFSSLEECQGLRRPGDKAVTLSDMVSSLALSFLPPLNCGYPQLQAAAFALVFPSLENASLRHG